jgi:hypothetical protein
VFIASKMVRALISWFNPPVRVCLIITTLSIQTHAQVGAIVTHCFGEPTEDINLWSLEMQNLSLAIIEQLLNRQDTILTNATSNITRKLNVSPTRRIGC